MIKEGFDGVLGPIGREDAEKAYERFFQEGDLFPDIAEMLQKNPDRVSEWWKATEDRHCVFLSFCSYREASFACHCPLCLGDKGEHTLRVVKWALATALAVHAGNAAPSEMAEWLLRAAMLLNPKDPNPPSVSDLTVSWVADDPFSDVLRQIHGLRPDWLLSPLSDLLGFLRRRRWDDGDRSLATTFPMATSYGNGTLAKLRLTLTSAPFPELYPDPRLLLAVRWDEEFADQLEEVWRSVHGSASPSRAVRWNLERYRNESRLWLQHPIAGPSIGAALGVGLKCLLDANALPPDADCALTGAVKSDGRLGSVGGYDPKTLLFNRYPGLRLVVPAPDHQKVCRDLPDWNERLLPADTLDDALRHATCQIEAVQKYLQSLIERLDESPWYHRGQRLSVRRTFAPLRVLVYEPVKHSDRPERRSAAPDEDSGEDRERLKPSDLFSERQAHLYELPEGRDKEEVRWQEFTRKLQQRRRAVLIGAPGSGKTFGTRHFILTLAEQSLQRLEQGHSLDALTAPFWLTAGQLAEASSAEDALLNGASPAAAEWLQDALQQGRAVIVVDALDELTYTQRARFRERSAELDKLHATVILTCRTLQWDERRDWLQWRRLPEPAELAPLNPGEQREIVQRFFADDADAARSLERILRRNFALRHACRTPLILTFVCLLHGDGILHEHSTYAKLYVHVLRELLCGRWRGVSEPLFKSRTEEAQLLPALDAIAYQLFRSAPHQNLFTLAQWKHAASKNCPMPPDELLERLERLGVVIPAGYDRRGDPQWSFAHRSLLEFCAARHLSRLPVEKWLAEVCDHFWFYPEWWEVLTFLAGLADDAQPLLHALQAEQDDIFGSMFILQARVAGLGRVPLEVVNQLAQRAVQRYLSDLPREFTLPALQSLSDHVVEPLIERLKDKDPNVSAAVCEALGRIGSEQAVGPLIERLKDGDWFVSRAACGALGQIGSEQAVGPLIERLKDGDWLVSEAACDALGQIGSEQAVEPLIECLKDEDPNVRAVVCEALGQIGSEQAVGPLIERLKDEGPNVRTAACRALGEIGSKQAVGPLIERLRDPWVRWVAYRALWRIEWKNRIPIRVVEGGG